MEKVERKKRKGGGPRRLLWLLGALALTGICVFAAVRLKGNEAPEMPEARPETRGSVTDRETAEIVRITVQAQGKEPWTAVRATDGTLRLEGEGDWVPDETLTGRLTDALANVVYEEVLTENPADYENRLADFGLDVPVLTATAEYADGTEITLRFGKELGLADRDSRYMTVDGDPRLFAAATSLLTDLQIEKELLYPVTQPEIQSQRMDRITVWTGEGKKRIEWVLDGQITDTDAAEEWMLNEPFRYPADFDTMTSLRQNAAGLRLGLYVGPAKEQDLRDLGLETPERVLEIHMAAGTTGQISEGGALQTVDRPEETLRLEIGRARNDLVSYVRLGEEIYTMNRFTLETLTEADPMESAARYPVTVPLSSLSEVSVEENGRRDVYTLEREIHPAEGEEESETVLRCRKNGEEISAEAFEAAYERLLVVTVSGRLPEGWEKKESTRVYVFRTLNGREHRVELSPYDALHDAVTLDGCTVFYLIRDGMTPLP